MPVNAMANVIMMNRPRKLPSNTLKLGERNTNIAPVIMKSNQANIHLEFPTVDMTKPPHKEQAVCGGGVN
jgi:hypothetical protein